MYAPGQRYEFRRQYHRTKYGDGCVVTRVSTSVDSPHAGWVHREWIDATTDNGTRIQWQRGLFARATTPVASPEDVAKVIRALAGGGA
jgi:hypothetical protein